MNNPTQEPEGYTVTTQTGVPLDRVADLLCCALEGGSAYWCESLKPAEYPPGVEWGHETVAHGVSFTIQYDGGERTYIQNSCELIAKTLQTMADTQPHPWADFMAENEDACTGDVFFQLLCFGEVIYG